MSNKCDRLMASFGQLVQVWPLVGLVIIVTACLPMIVTKSEPAPTERATVIVPDSGTRGVIVVETRTPPTTAGEQIETVSPETVATLPPEIIRSFNREQCLDYCWHNIMLGQSEVEAVAAIRNDPATNSNYFVGLDDVVNIERLANNRVGINWGISGIPYQRFRSYGSLLLDDDMVTFLVVPIEPPFPLQAVLDKLGEPELLTFFEGRYEDVYVILFYPQERVSFFVRLAGEPETITGESLVESVAYYDAELAQDNYCITGYYRWDGLGDTSKYSPQSDEGLYIDRLPEECSEHP